MHTELAMIQSITEFPMIFVWVNNHEHFELCKKRHIDALYYLLFCNELCPIIRIIWYLASLLYPSQQRLY